MATFDEDLLLDSKEYTRAIRFRRSRLTALATKTYMPKVSPAQAMLASRSRKNLSSRSSLYDSKEGDPDYPIKLPGESGLRTPAEPAEQDSEPLPPRAVATIHPSPSSSRVGLGGKKKIVSTDGKFEFFESLISTAEAEVYTIQPSDPRRRPPRNTNAADGNSIRYVINPVFVEGDPMSPRGAARSRSLPKSTSVDSLDRDDDGGDAEARFAAAARHAEQNPDPASSSSSPAPSPPSSDGSVASPPSATRRVRGEDETSQESEDSQTSDATEAERDNSVSALPLMSITRRVSTIPEGQEDSESRAGDSDVGDADNDKLSPKAAASASTTTTTANVTLADFK